MKLVFLSNYYNHHQKHIADEFYKLTNGDFCFIETAQMSEERAKLGYKKYEGVSYVLQAYKNGESAIKCQEIIDNAEIVIYGSAPYKLLKKRLKSKKLTFLYSERIYKQGFPSRLKLFLQRIVYSFKYKRHKNFYLLCASAFSALDYSKTGSFLSKSYKWGYFPQFVKYGNINEIITDKKKNSILWCGRFIDWKHPEMMIELAEKLKEKNIPFEINMIGTGELFDDISMLIKNKNLEEYVKLLGAMPPERVREHMERAEIFAFTSDRNEGWGAVLNEAMNSACAVVASEEIGSVPFLVRDGESGLIYKKGDKYDFCNKIDRLLGNEQERKNIARNAYEAILNEWNAEVAAKRFFELADELSKLKTSEKYCGGPCSRALIIED